ncbi:MAG: O-antigen ligase family protein [Muribaculaceae bacterium]|nr:O-antigen ligase family protein [Muribaculaceae bacterium]
MLERSIDITSNRAEKWLYRLLALAGMVGIVVSLAMGNFILFAIIFALPLSIITIMQILRKPSLLLYIIFIVNYFILAITRYLPNASGISVIMDSLLAGEMIVLFINSSLTDEYSWKATVNSLTVGSLVWMLYCLVEIVNPTGMISAWALSRSLVFNGFFVALITTMVVRNFRQITIILDIYAILTIIAVAKAFMQKFMGFDSAEQKWLDEGGALTHIIGSGIRYFSIFTDAGNFGSNMGCAAIVFMVAVSSCKNTMKKISYVIIAGLAIYAMFMSGTRGAMIVPLGGMVMMIIIAKNYKVIAIGGTALAALYVFFAFTYIGNGNAMIARMRTAFHPEEDASYNVRKQNQEKLAAYLKNKPMGEGLGLSGVENQKTSMRFTTQIPTDSWYVKLWVETGAVGLTIYLAMFLIAIINAAYILMFKVNNKRVKSALSAMLCGVFGMLLSAYGNGFFGQFPTMIIVYTFLASAMNGQKIDESFEPDESADELKTK